MGNKKKLQTDKNLLAYINKQTPWKMMMNYDDDDDEQDEEIYHPIQPLVKLFVFKLW